MTPTEDKKFILKARIEWQTMRNQIVMLEALALLSPAPLSGHLRAESQLTRALWKETHGEDFKYECGRPVTYLPKDFT